MISLLIMSCEIRDPYPFLYIRITATGLISYLRYYIYTYLLSTLDMKWLVIIFYFNAVTKVVVMIFIQHHRSIIIIGGTSCVWR